LRIHFRLLWRYRCHMREYTEKCPIFLS
jgi:hypothetical protein